MANLLVCLSGNTELKHLSVNYCDLTIPSGALIAELLTKSTIVWVWQDWTILLFRSLQYFLLLVGMAMGYIYDWGNYCPLQYMTAFFDSLAFYPLTPTVMLSPNSKPPTLNSKRFVSNSAVLLFTFIGINFLTYKRINCDRWWRLPGGERPSYIMYTSKLADLIQCFPSVI